MSATGRFVCAFRGARDRYQAAVALAETGELETLITDAYATPLAKSLKPFLPRWRGWKIDGTPCRRRAG